MEQHKINIIHSTFNYFLENEERIFKALDDKDDFDIALDIVETLNQIGILEYQTAFIKLGKKDTLTFHMILKEHIRHVKLANTLKFIDSKYDNVEIETFATLDGVCNYKINIFDENKKNIKMTFNVIHPLINVFETLPSQA